ncbi:hypothetical protein OKW29_002225 [Paraburkholderia sp. CI3]
MAFHLKTPSSCPNERGHLSSYFGLVGIPSHVIVQHSDSHAHNSYLNILAEFGIVGLVLMLNFYWKLIAWSQRGAAASALHGGGRNFAAFRFVEISSVCLLVMSATEHRLVSPSNVLILSLVVSLLLAWRPPPAPFRRSTDFSGPDSSSKNAIAKGIRGRSR